MSPEFHFFLVISFCTVSHQQLQANQAMIVPVVPSRFINPSATSIPSYLRSDLDKSHDRLIR